VTVEENGESESHVRTPISERRDATMRYIAKNKLWGAVALQCGITPSAVRIWWRVPAARVRDVEAAIGRSRVLIRPDLYRRKPRKSPENRIA
jgi:hypothetical protein